MSDSKLATAHSNQGLETAIRIVRSDDELPPGIDRRQLAHFLHETLKPYEDPQVEVRRGIDHALDRSNGKSGFVVLGTTGERLTGALVMLDTGMGGYVPANLLLFVAVNQVLRGQGIGRSIIEAALEQCDGEVKLHVEYDNPAKRLYERIGFRSKYAEMRYAQ